jgi:transposase
VNEKRLFEAALGVAAPWYVSGTEFDAGSKRLTICIDFVAGSRFAHPEVPGKHPVHDTQAKRYRHLNFFQHDCFLEVRVPRLKLPDGRVALIEPDWAGRLSGFTLLFEALVLMLSRQMPFPAVARLVGESWHRVHAICSRYVDLAVEALDLSEARALAIDETSYQRGHHCLTLAADADRRSVVFVTPGRGSDTLGVLANHLRAHQAAPEPIESVSIDMSPAYIRGASEHLPAARITFDRFHVIAQASAALDRVRRQEQRAISRPVCRSIWTRI